MVSTRGELSKSKCADSSTGSRRILDQDSPLEPPRKRVRNRLIKHPLTPKEETLENSTPPPPPSNPDSPPPISVPASQAPPFPENVRPPSAETETSERLLLISLKMLQTVKDVNVAALTGLDNVFKQTEKLINKENQVIDSVLMRMCVMNPELRKHLGDTSGGD